MERDNEEARPRIYVHGIGIQRINPMFGWLEVGEEWTPSFEFNDIWDDTVRFALQIRRHVREIKDQL